jgi:hypothetical protein
LLKIIVYKIKCEIPRAIAGRSAAVMEHFVRGTLHLRSAAVMEHFVRGAFHSMSAALEERCV